ncbi:MAG: type II toxin-antitoxin system PemK/MazF family toxin [Oscillospiraceae bacterium]|nr:type II toxin-antitoxin system PemK/MazF family toxin [Oscillospiraceae bacterium]
MVNKISRGDMFYIYKYMVCGCEQMAGRPAIIVSNDACNRSSETVEVIYLTTQDKTPLPTHVAITSSPKESTALCEQITTVSVDRIGDYCGHLTEEEVTAVDDAIRISLALKQEKSIPSAEPTAPAGSLELLQQLSVALAERDVYKKLYTELLDRLIKGC